MSISQKELYNIYGKYLPVFTELANIAKAEETSLELYLDKDGSIRFESSDYEDAKDKTICRQHHIYQDKGHVSDGNDTYTWEK